MKNNKFRVIKIFAILYLVFTVVLPLVKLIFNIQINDIETVVQSTQFLPMLKNSLVTTTISTLISVVLAFGLAWCINRTNIKYKTLLAILFTIPMLIPSISHGMGLVLLLGSNGIITNLTNISIELYGYLGIVLGSVLYSFPVAFLLLSDGFKYEDFTVYEAAEVLGLSKLDRFKNITLMNLKGPIISAIFAVFTMVFTDYGVPLTVGGKIMTLPVYMYREVIGLLDFSKGAIIGSILLIPAFVQFILDVKKNEQKSISSITKEFVIGKNKIRDGISTTFCWLIVILISLPLAIFLILSFVNSYPIDMSFSINNIIQAFDLGLSMYLENSIAIALAASLIGTAITYFTAYITSRSKKSLSNMALHLISLISLAIPGVVLGLCYVLFFNGSIIYGSIVILILVNITHFFASPYLMAYNSLLKFSSNIEDVSETIGISKIRLLLDVYIPCTKETILEMYSYFFVNSMVTISAVSFLSNFKTMPLSLLIPQFDSQSLIEATAFISVVIFTANVLLKTIIHFVKKKLVTEA